GKRVVIIGRSDIVGKPVGFLIMHRHGTITICHSRTENLSEVAREGDILIAAVGKAKMIKNDFVKKNAVVVDAGYNVEGEEVYGDVDLNDVKNKARCITPVPNGVGTVTTSMIFKNLILAHKYQNE
ncbi:MAG TPA: bifunctional methylenetetrahydrofolate dehydrogenase/methenyltetrahydrofolate cyclohydrolase, partial [Candidatus Mcinerneyibacterium sp.]|nr:bifunctional methylenetetrahydrofolate dehydrogenase/methenyltetrahydrofolate cyclohydrolase [Candidatus Mcinerneyibacterium sp.]